MPDDRSLYWGNVAANLLMLPWPFRFPGDYDNLFPLNYPAWSLFYEMIAYTLFARVVRHLTTARLALLIAAGFAALLYTGLTEATLDRGTWRPSFAGTAARVVFCFFTGVALHRLRLSRPPRLAPHPAIMMVLLALPLLWRPDPEGQSAWLYELAVIALWMPLMVWQGSGSVARVAWRQTCSALGAISYPLYAIHAPIYLFAGRYDNWQGSVFLNGNQPWAALGLVALLCVAAWLLATFVDLPIRRRLSALVLDRRTRHPTAVESAKASDPVSAP